jgi:hypothetical protein
MTTPPTPPVPPVPPQTSDPSDFDPRADDFVAYIAGALYAFFVAFIAWITQFQADTIALFQAAQSVAATGSNTIGTGTKTHIVPYPSALQPGVNITAAAAGSASNQNRGIVQTLAQIGSTAFATLTMNVASSGDFSGAGTFTNWQLTSTPLVPKASVATVRANVDDTSYLTSKVMADEAGFVALTDAATIAIDYSAGRCRSVVLGGARTFGVPTNGYDNATLKLKFDCNGFMPAWSTGTGGFDFGATGIPTPVTTAGKIHYVYADYDSARNKWIASYWIPA